MLYDPLDAAAPYSLRGVMTHFGPAGDYGYPLCAESLWLYAEVFGEPGRYLVRAALVALDDDGDDLGPPTVVRD